MSRKRRERLTTLIIITLIVVISMVVYYVRDLSNPESELSDAGITVHIIDVGQGNAAFIDNGEKDILIDAGPGSSADELVSYLEEMEVGSIEYAFFSHPHEDHIGGADEVLERFEIKNVVIPYEEGDSECYRVMMESVENEKAEIIYASSGDSFEIGEAGVNILSPQKDIDCGDDLNLCSLVMRVTYGECSFVFTGDAVDENEEYILDNYADSIDSDFLFVGHHGSNTSSSVDFIKALSPEIAVISCAEGNEYGHPHAQTLDTLKKYAGEIYRTDREGDIVVSCDGKDIFKVK